MATFRTCRTTCRAVGLACLEAIIDGAGEKGACVVGMG